MSENHVIGRNGQLPWSLPDEWGYFREVTAGKPFLMGRKSYQAADALHSTYRNVVLSTQPDLPLHERSERAGTLPEALALLAAEEEVFVLGGVAVFREVLPLAQKLYLSVVHAELDGDAFFPVLDWADWKLTASRHHGPDQRHAYGFTMNQYQRIPNPPIS